MIKVLQGAKYLKFAYAWIENYPRALMEVLKRSDQSFEEFCDDLKDDLILTFLIADSPLAVCVAEDKGDGFFDVHIESPRHLSAELIEMAIFGFRNELRDIEKVKNCSFRFPAAEKKIFNALERAGAVRSGWQFFQPNGLRYEIMVWDAK